MAHDSQDVAAVREDVSHDTGCPTRDSNSSSSDLGSRGTGLRELRAKWRARIARQLQRQSGIVDEGLQQCADELDAALSAPLLVEEGRQVQKDQEDTRVDKTHLRHPADNPTAASNEAIRAAINASIQRLQRVQDCARNATVCSSCQAAVRAVVEDLRAIEPMDFHIASEINELLQWKAQDDVIEVSRGQLWRWRAALTRGRNASEPA